MDDYRIIYGHNFIEDIIPNILNANLSKAGIETVKDKLISQKLELYNISEKCNELLIDANQYSDFDYGHCILIDITNKISIDFINQGLDIL